MADEHTLTYVGALALPPIAAYLVLFRRLVASASKVQRQLLVRPKSMAFVNVLSIAIVLIILTKLESQPERLLGAAGSAALLGMMTAFRLNPTLLAKLHRLNALAALAVALVLIAFVLDRT